MVQVVIGNADIVKVEGRRWQVRHPSNGAILAYCDTEGEAKSVRSALDAVVVAFKERE